MTELESPVPTALPTKDDVRALRARAHALKPVVWIGQGGASEAALREIDRALAAHELIKIHAAVDARSARESLLAAICARLGAHPVQVIGKMLVAFRARPAEIDTPPARARAASGRSSGARARPASGGSSAARARGGKIAPAWRQPQASSKQRARRRRSPVKP
ncbi:MAG: YhbY family RNA-binding protein [Burkholderiales bacterium]|nr:YhbY family RNA-binding protein [Burkholderiales bacterium]